MKPHEYREWHKHLTVFAGAIEKFCAETDFRDNRLGLGRYPRRRLTRAYRVTDGDGAVMEILDLMMDEGFQEYTDQVTYSLGAAITYDQVSTLTRYGMGFPLFESLKVNTAATELYDYLVCGRKWLAGCSVEELVRFGDTTYLTSARGLYYHAKKHAELKKQ